MFSRYYFWGFSGEITKGWTVIGSGYITYSDIELDISTAIGSLVKGEPEPSNSATVCNPSSST